MSDDDTYDLSRRKILGGIMTVGAAGATAGAGTMALFSDTEQSTGNTIQAGTLNLDAAANDDTTGDGTATTTLTVSNVAPGDSGGQTSTLENTGSIDGELSLVFGSGDNAEGDDPESDTNTSSPGDLGDVVHVTVTVGGTTIRQGTFNAVFDGTREWYDTPGTLAAGSTKDLTIDWSLPAWAGNDVQGDEVSGDITVELVQSGATLPSYFADVVVDASGGADATTIDDGEDMASQGDTILVRDGTYSSGWVDVKTPGVTLVSETEGGVTCNSTITIERSNVAVFGFDVRGGYEGITVEPDDGASSGVVIADNRINDITDNGDDGSGKESGKDESFGVLAWSTDSNLQDIVIRGNTIENVGRDDSMTYSSQGFGIFVEGLSFGTGGATIEHNTLNNIRGGDQDGDTYPGVGVAVLPEHTNPDLDSSSSGVGVGEANASVTDNTFSGTTVDVSVAGDVDQLVVADNSFTADYNVFTKGTVPNLGRIGIMNVGSATTSVVSGTARYVQ